MSSRPVQKQLKSGIKQGIGVVFEYETQKIVQINSKKVGIINRLIQVFIVSYIIGWVMIYKKGYQENDKVVSGVTTKVKGIQYTNFPNTTIGARIWDVADYVIPPQENNAFFITTNVIVTPDQHQGQCDEDPNVPGAKCATDTDCQPPLRPIPLGNGVTTGRCINSTQKAGVKVCEIHSWCPVEIDELPAGKQTIFPEAVNFTVLIKNSIKFPKFNVKRRNILPWFSKSFLYNCRWHPTDFENKFCPIVSLQDILHHGNISKSILVKGGVVAININWDCNLDWSETFCNPVYSFYRLDDEFAAIAKGWNFRYSNNYKVNGTEYRTLIKAYGIRFIVFVTGQAGKFNVIPLTMNLGSGLALLSIASILCDMIVVYLLSKKGVYREAKYEKLEGDDAYKILDDENAVTDSDHASGAPRSLQSKLDTSRYGAVE